MMHPQAAWLHLDLEDLPWADWPPVVKGADWTVGFEFWNTRIVLYRITDDLHVRGRLTVGTTVVYHGCVDFEHRKVSVPAKNQAKWNLGIKQARTWHRAVLAQQELKSNTKGKRTK